MSWVVVLTIALGAYGAKLAGVEIGSGQVAAMQRGWVALLPPALLGALVAVQTLGADERIVVDARLVGVIAGGLAAWRRAPFVMVLVVAAATTALVRAAT